MSGGNYEINRAVCEDPRVDILAHPELRRIDSGLDQVCLEAATRNNVAIQINFREILYSFRRPRSYILNHVTKNIMLTNHFRTPVIICSGAQSTWDMRAPRELVSIANVLGLDLGKAFLGVTSVPQQIVENNKKVLEGRKVTEGVEIIEWLYGRGKILTLGDIDIITNDPNIGINQKDNRKFIINVFNWLIEPIKESSIRYWALDQLGNFQNDIREINNKINNLIESMTLLERRISVLEQTNDVNPKSYDLFEKKLE